MKSKEIEKQVLKKIKPNSKQRQRLKETVEKIEDKLKKSIRKQDIPIKIELVGSIAKDTYLIDSLDIDLFLSYPPTISKQKIADKTIQIGKKILERWTISYAEHPYIKGFFDGYQIELVPCYRVEDISQKMSAVDRTPLHTEYIKKNLNEKQKDEVRLLKKFLKGIGCYGAENKIRGFSGYLCEILVLKYKNFRNLLKNSAEWKKGIKISLSDEKSPEFDDPLTFIDPVDSERNVASALSEKNFDLFKKASQSYLKQPRITFFYPNKIKQWKLSKIKKNLEQQNKKYVGVEIPKPKIIDENLYPQIRKACRSVKEKSEEKGFKILDVDFYIDEKQKKIYIIIKTNKKPLPLAYTHMGPPVSLQKNKQEFVKKWKNNSRLKKGPFEKNGRIYVKVKRKHRRIEGFLEDNFPDLSLGKNIDKKVEKKYKILKQKELIKENLKVFWTKHLDKKMPWER
ncbi:MAG: CCA tRNA nucleotidyltransferase [Candidatus Thermoplasmatota archaeon]